VGIPVNHVPLILKRAPVGDNPDDYSVLENGVVVGRIFKAQVAPEGRPWMWASGHGAGHLKRAAHGYEPTRDAAMAAFTRSWRGETGGPYRGHFSLDYPDMVRWAERKMVLAPVRGVS
jgi:hypothetical protein